tara:strand:- start:4 stop:612 length:609 start_codon:yes stop_codon:yes gene_type:complete
VSLKKIFLNYEAILFDLDGTLIDSKNSILRTLETSLAKNSIFLEEPINESVIGMPLDSTIRSIVGDVSQSKIKKIITSFIDEYDESGWKKCRLYPGVRSLIESLINKDIYIVTNKRKAPTLLILNKLSMSHLFKKVYSIDSFKKKITSKKELLAKVLREEKIKKEKSLYVGDTDFDQEASKKNGIDFLRMDHISEPFLKKNK